jgi:hypothetical protein
VKGEALPAAADLGVSPGDRDVVEEDVALGVPADPCGVAVQEELAAGVRPPLHDEDPAATLELLGRDVYLFLEVRLELAGHERDRGVLAPGLRERRAAGGAEVGSLRVPVTAVVTEHQLTL